MGRKNNLNKRKDKTKTENNVNSEANLFSTEIEQLFQICCEPICDIDLWDNYKKIREILNKMIIPEDSISDSSERIETVQEFISWLESNGAKFDGVRIDDCPPYGLGLRANTNFSEGEIVLQIPRAIIFNVYTAASELKQLQSDVLVHSMPQIALAIALLLEKNKATSFWRPYLNILPKIYHTILYSDEDDLILLKGSSNFEKSLKHCRNIVRQYAYLYKIFHNCDGPIGNLMKNSFTYEQYRWAVSTVMTRQNLIPNEDGSGMVYSLIPMWDMCNHQEGKITTDFDLQSNSCKCYAMKNFEKNDQIFIYYGPRTNSELFLHSGFIYPGNKSDSFQIRLGLSKLDILYTKKANLLLKLGLPVIGEYTLKPGLNPLSGPLSQFLRIFCMDQDQITYFLDNDAVANIMDCKFDKEMRRRELNTIVDRLRIIARNCILKMENNGNVEMAIRPTRKMAMQLRKVEKEIIERLILDLQKQYDGAAYD